MITEYLKKRKNACKELIKRLRKVYSYASILGVDTDGFSISLDRYSTNIADSPSSERGFVVKVYDGKGYLEYSFDDITDENVQDIYDKVVSLKTNEALRVNAKMLEDEKLEKVFSRVDENPMEINEIVPILIEMRDEALNENELIFNALCRFEKFNLSKIFISENKDLEQDYVWCQTFIVPMARRDQTIKSARAGKGGCNTKGSLQETKAKIKEACKLSVDLLDSLPIIPGVYDVITDPSITGLIAHEAFGHGVEMDMFVKNRAKSKDYFGKYVASPITSMHDGAISGYSVASYFFDDDGVLAHDTLIIKDGILVSGMSDALSAMQLGTVPTGNGRRESYTHKAYTRMTNTFFVPGKDKVEDMIKSIDYGFYLCDTNNGMEDPKNWQIQCVCEYAREIKDGKFTGRLFSPVVLSGYVLDLLKSITMVSDAFELDGAGYCGKGHKEWVRVSDGGPHLKAKVKLG